MRKISSYSMILVTLVAAVGMTVWVLNQPAPRRDVVRIGFQDADAPLGMTANGVIDHRFQFLSAWQLAEIPLATRFDAPMGSESGALAYNAQKFWEMNEKRGGHHSGDDFNGIGGQNSDLGDPVFSVADGWVVYAGEPSPGWGKTVMIAHRTQDGKLMQSMYAHLERIDVSLGTMVGRGKVIGTVGTANGSYLAHLHFEMRDSDHVDIGGGYMSAPLNRLDPAATVMALRNADADDLSPSILAMVLDDLRSPWSNMEINGVEKLLGLPNGGVK